MGTVVDMALVLGMVLNTMPGLSLLDPIGRYLRKRQGLSTRLIDRQAMQVQILHMVNPSTLLKWRNLIQTHNCS